MRMRLINIGEGLSMSLDLDKVIYVTPVSKGSLIKFTNGEFQIVKLTVEEIHKQLVISRRKK